MWGIVADGGSVVQVTGELRRSTTDPDVLVVETAVGVLLVDVDATVQVIGSPPPHLDERTVVALIAATEGYVGQLAAVGPVADAVGYDEVLAAAGAYVRGLPFVPWTGSGPRHVTEASYWAEMGPRCPSVSVDGVQCTFGEGHLDPSDRDPRVASHAARSVTPESSDLYDGRVVAAWGDDGQPKPYYLPPA